MAAALGLSFSLAQAQAGKAPDVLIKEVSTDVLDTLRADKSIKQGDVQKVIALVDQKVMPHVDFQRMATLTLVPLGPPSPFRGAIQTHRRRSRM